MSRFRFRMRRPASPPTEDLASALLENLSDAVMACDAAGNTVMYNRRAREILGTAGESVPSEEWTERCPIYRPDGTQVVRTEDLPLARALKGEDVRDVRLEVRPNGGRHIMNVSGSAVRGPRGDIRGAVIVMQEITARVAIEERLLLEGAIAANVAEGIVLVRASDGQIVYANDRWERMFGYDHGEPIGDPISIVNAPTGQAPEERAQEIIRAIDRNGTWSGEVHNVRKDGTRFWSAASISTFEHPEHGVVWAAVQTDMTERKAAEEALRAAEERFRQVFEDGPLGILIVDNDLRMIDANQAFSAITGYRREELVGRPCTDISHPDDLALESELGANLAAGEIPRYRIERRFVTKQGEAMPVIQTTTVVRGADGEPLYRVATVEELAGS